MTAKILLVEDNDDNWEMLSRRLGRRAYEVERAVDGPTAVAKAFAGFDLVLMDINLPLMDGLEAIRRIRSSETQRTPIIALSAHALASDEAKALAAGADGYHTKPVDFPRLLEQIEQSITRRAHDPPN